MLYPLYYGEINKLQIRIEGKRNRLQIVNYVTIDYDTKEKNKIMWRYKKIEKFMREIKKGINVDTRLFIRETNRGYHFLIAFKKDFDLAKDNRPLKLRKKFFDDKDRIKIDTYRIDALHYMPYLFGVLFDCKDGSYRGKRWIEIDVY